MKRILPLVVFILFCFESDVVTQTVYAGVVPNYSQFVSMNTGLSSGCSGATSDVYFNLDGDTTNDVISYGNGHCEMGTIGLKHGWLGYIKSLDSSIEFSYITSSYQNTCTIGTLCTFLNSNATIGPSGY